MAIVKRHAGDKTRVNAKGVLIVTRKNGNVVRVNAKKGTIVRKKADGTVVKQKLSKPKINTRFSKIISEGQSVIKKQIQAPIKKPRVTPIKGMK